MDDSILNSIKKKLGIIPEYTQFDSDIIVDINSVFMVFQQIGVGPDITYSISGETETWSDFFSKANVQDVNAAKSLMYLKVRMLFDPPTVGSVNDAFNKMIDELTWRCSIEGDKINDGNDDGNDESTGSCDQYGISTFSSRLGDQVRESPMLLHGPNFNKA